MNILFRFGNRLQSGPTLLVVSCQKTATLYAPLVEWYTRQTYIFEHLDRNIIVNDVKFGESLTGNPELSPKMPTFGKV